ncbi:MAG: ATP-binding cassette domain-containing protein [Thermosphaera sp.]
MKEGHYLLEVRNVIKRFGDIVALKGVSLNVRYGEVVGIVGDNGAGKSTLAKIIAGIYEPDEGEIIFKGQKLEKLTPKRARELGIEMVHQERTVMESHPVWRNVFAGREITNSLGLLKIREMKEESRKLLSKVGFSEELTNPELLVRGLSGGLKQGVQIARALYFNADLLILDEPTSNLSIAEAQRVLEFVEALKTEGRSCIFITHNIYHVYPVADRIIILDRGRVVGEFRKEEVSIDAMPKILVHVARTGELPREVLKLAS